MATSDINAQLNRDLHSQETPLLRNLDEIKNLCKQLYVKGKIDFAGNGRYFILAEDKKEPKEASTSKSEEIDIEKELEKFKVLLGKGLINQEDYDAKKKKLLGL